MKGTALLVLLLISIECLADAPATSGELNSIAQLLRNTEKLTQNKTVRSQIKRSRKQVERVQELWGLGAVPNSLSLLLDIRRSLYRLGGSESAQFQENVHSAMKRLWPFLLKTGRFRSDTHALPGVRLVRLIVPEGTYTMSFPHDAKPGEVISGRIHAFPAASASLYLLTLMGSPVVADGSLRKWQLPESFEFIASDVWGNEVVRTEYRMAVKAEAQTVSVSDPDLQEEKQPTEPKPNIEIPHLRFEISSRAKAGGHLIVKGPFDGDFSNTTVGIGKYQAHIVAESPGRLVLGVHPQLAGDWTILISEADNWVRCRVRVQAEEVDPFETLTICTPPA